MKCEHDSPFVQAITMKTSIKAMKAIAVFDRRESTWLAEKLLDDGTLDCQLVDVEEFLVDIDNFDRRVERLGAPVDIVLLDSALPSAFLTKIVLRMRDKAPGLPILLLPQLPTQRSATTANLNGAQLRPPGEPHDKLSNAVLSAIRYARGRERLQRKLLQAALKDDLTGLHNRRGFRQFAKQHLRLARNMKQQLLLFFADLDGLKQINDEFGHRVGDEALIAAAAIIKKTFRKSDITARLSGDEFVALVMDEPGRRAERIRDRLLINVDKYAGKDPRYSLSLSVGVARIDPNTGASLHTLLAQLMTQADAAMYSQKRQIKSVIKDTGRQPVGKHSTVSAPPPVVNAPHLMKRPVRGDPALSTGGEDAWMPAAVTEMPLPSVPP